MARRLRRFVTTPGGVVVPAPRLWYNFEAANVTKASDLISQVNDLSGNAEHMTEATGTRQPLWVDNGAPGGATDAVEFDPDGTNLKRLTRTPVAAPFGAAGYTIFFAFNRITAATGNWSMWSYNNGAVRGGWSLQTTSGANGRRFEARTSAGTAKSVTFGTYTLDTPEVWCVVNGGADDSDSSATFLTEVNGANVAWTGSPWFWIPTGSFGAAFNNTGTGSGNKLRIFEAMAFDVQLDAAQRLAVTRQIGARQGITVA